MANTYTLISSVTVGAGGAASIDFTSIPATYTDLKLVLSLRGNAAQYDDYINLRFNNDSGANYSARNLSAVGGGGVDSRSWSAQTYGYAFQIDAANSTANTFGNVEIYIPNYTSSNTKSFSNDGVAEQNGDTWTNRQSSLNAGLWSGTAAINRITLSVGGSTLWVQYSTAYLYGIKNS